MIAVALRARIAGSVRCVTVNACFTPQRGEVKGSAQAVDELRVVLDTVAMTAIGELSNVEVGRVGELREIAATTDGGFAAPSASRFHHSGVARRAGCDSPRFQQTFSNRIAGRQLSDQVERRLQHWIIVS